MPAMIMKRLLRTALRTLGILVFLFLGLILFAPLGTNLWFLLTEESYFIPEESSVFTFRPLQLNPGPGDYWIYGEDSRRYYHLISLSPPSCRVFSRKESKALEDFNPLDIATWE
ncbi:hypothetical protein B4O97_15765 [Marispirochaeta aestuarii]|uniref:Uncharacterized protein n=2 Tax=Marispirochaeta aestuarii TaxID=1963862 RepID=A0A1Y1RW06_9SPIO|nr:hypothetical protein B4O97_15765 [Marispirochaeta aestuarii]